MPDPVPDRTLATVWRRYRECAAFARSHQAKYDRLRLWALALTVFGSVLAAAADQVKRLQPAAVTTAATSHFGPEVILGVASALALALAAFIAQRLLASKEARDWVVARAVGEALKSEVFRYAARVEPYADPASRAGALLDQQAKIEVPVAALALPTVSEEDAVRNLPSPALTAAGYVDTRAGEQEAWYRTNADRHKTLRERWEKVGLLLAIAAIVIGAVRTFFDDKFVAGWLAVLGGIGAAIAAHVAAQRHKAIEEGYRAAAKGLRQRIDRWQILSDAERESDPARSALVVACEGVMRTENGAWMAEWMEAIPAPSAPPPTANSP